MKENKNTCPVCFTKMRAHNDGLVCPECGYKLCDHKYKSQDIYNTNHTHTPEYTTSYPAARTGNTSTPASNRTNSAPSSTNVDPRAKKIIKIIRIFVILYVIGVLFSVFGSFFTSILNHLLF